jgi:hypothetical protein
MPSATLVRHPDTPSEALRAVEASEVREGNELRLAYVLHGQIDRVRLPTRRAAGALWQHTCCELFVARALPAYREYNFSPSAEWAAYSFGSYRNGAAVEVPNPRIALQRGNDQLKLTASVPAERGPMRIGLSVVVEEQNISYWALRHAPGKPDFHHPESFVLELPRPA